jgi:hypothetical protein
MVLYGSTAPSGQINFRMSRGTKVYAAVGALCAVTLLMISMAAVLFDIRGSLTALDEVLGEDLDSKFFLAEGSGKDGREFLERLQRIWFVSSNKKLTSLRQEATRIVSKLQIASFPTQVQNAVNMEVNPCEDFYEFAVGRLRVLTVISKG